MHYRVYVINACKITLVTTHKRAGQCPSGRPISIIISYIESLETKISIDPQRFCSGPWLLDHSSPDSVKYQPTNQHT